MVNDSERSKKNFLTDEGTIADPYRNFIAVSRYARWDEQEERRETWEETVSRYSNFVDEYLRKNHPGAAISVPEIRQAILGHQVMPSMRSLMTAGPALARDNVAGYNCAFLGVDNPRCFDEAMYISMCGTGVGFSVEPKYVDKLPPVNEHFETSETTIIVEDSKAGWARSFRELLALLWQGQIPQWNLERVRPAGAKLKTFGGRASGPGPLNDLFNFCVEVFRNAKGRRLKPIEVHDIMCKVGEVVVAGGVRRSAMISLSSLEDYDMAKAKSGSWWDSNPQRALANNSAVYERKPSVGEFLKEWGHLYDSKSGERGIFSLENAQNTASATGRRDGTKVAGVNPCGEVLLRSKEFCNLSEVVVEASDSLDDLKDKVRIATIIGTIQSAWTNFKYLRAAWRTNCEDERLLGVSLTGQFGHPVLSGNEGLGMLADWLDEMRETAIAVNKEYADMLGINQSAGITVVKPSGTVSQLAGVSSGMHPWHSEHYLRSVRGDNKDPLTQFLKDAGIPNEPDVMKALDTTVFYFPVQAPKGAITRDNLTAIQHLEIWKVYKTHWTEHNPSITVTVREDEWVGVAAWVFNNWDVVGGVSFLPHSDHSYKQAPYQEITEEEYQEFLTKMPNEIHWDELSFYEHEDSTTGSQTLACSAGSCDVADIGSVAPPPSFTIQMSA